MFKDVSGATAHIFSMFTFCCVNSKKSIRFKLKINLKATAHVVLKESPCIYEYYSLASELLKGIQKQTEDTV